MFKYIILCLCMCLSGGLCDLNQQEGAECEWEGLKGKCVKETRCMTTLDDNSPKHPMCSTQDGDTLICCTDCELVNNTEYAVLSPTSGIYWKNGEKARDNCLQYLKDLPYQCKLDGYYSWITRKLDETKKCYTYDQRTLDVAPPPGRQRNAEYPHKVLLGYNGDDALTAEWKNVGGFIISDEFIITTSESKRKLLGDLKFVAMGVKNRSASPSSWQIRKIKRVITYPEYRPTSLYHSIALIETDTPIEFNEDVLPVCLHVEEDVAVDDAVVTTWFNLQSPSGYRDPLADTIQTIKVQKLSEEECKAAYGPFSHLKRGYDHDTQMCYGNNIDGIDTCLKSTAGEPLLVDTQFSSCVHTAIGVSFYCKAGITHTAYTRIAHYVPWIESIVWP